MRRRTKRRQTAKEIEDADGFAQVFPEHKFHIVDVLQKRDHIVGMTGDGVNDAPALKKADCGFAVSGATDAARAAASIVLVAPGLSVIIDAIKESREIFVRMNSYAMYRIAETLRVLLFMTLAIVVFNFFPVNAIMIVMLALLNDGAILSIAYDNVRARDEPEAWDMRMVLTIATVLGVVGPIAAFGLFYLGDRIFDIDRPQLQTMMYLLLVGGRSSHDLPDPHSRGLVDGPASASSLVGGRGNSGPGDLHLRFWVPRNPAVVGLGGAGLGLCPDLVPRHGSHQIARLSLSRLHEEIWTPAGGRRRGRDRKDQRRRAQGSGARSRGSDGFGR